MTQSAENDAALARLGVMVCRRATMHTAFCSEGEGHPHRDCYCNVYWNDDEPKSPCPECVTSPA